MSKAGINRNLPNDEYQAATNSNNPSATNPFITDQDIQALNIGGGLSIELSSFYVTIFGTANVGIAFTGDQLEYQIEGVGGAGTSSKNSYFQFVVPEGYTSGGSISVISSVTNATVDAALVVQVNGSVDSATGPLGVSLNTAPVLYPSFDKITVNLASSIQPGDIILLTVRYANGSNGDDAFVAGISFNYNIDIA